MPSAEQILSGELKKRGFQKLSKTRHLLLKDDVIVGIFFEKPTYFLYIQFFILPLFLPWKGRYTLDYGNRFNMLFEDVHTPIKEEGPEAIEWFCRTVLRHLDEDILPFVDSISRAENLCPYMEVILQSPNKLGRRHYLFAAPAWKRRLLMYGYSYLKQYRKAREIAEEQLRYVNTESIYTVNVNEGIRSECDQIIQWVSAGEYDKIEAMIERNKNDNLALLEKKKK